MPRRDPLSPGRWFPGDNRDGLPKTIRTRGAFLPTPLPSDLSLHTRTYRRLAEAERALGRLEEAANRLPDRSPLVRGTQVREIQSSVGRDGLVIALEEVLEDVLLSDELGGEGVLSANDVVHRYMTAFDAAFTAVREGAPIDVALLSHISAELAGWATNSPYNWRSESAWLGGKNPQDAWLLASPPGPDTIAVTEQVAVWLNADRDLPIVGRIALGHWLLAILQPFAGAGGDLARLYVGLELVRSGVLQDQILPFSLWLDSNNAAYRAGLLRAAEHGDFDHWVSVFADGIRQQCLGQTNVINKMEDLRAKQLKKASAQGRGLSKTREVVAALIGRPIFNHRQLEKNHKMSRQAATGITDRLQKAELIEILKNEKYKKVFVCRAVVELLTLNDPPPPAHDDHVYPHRC